MLESILSIVFTLNIVWFDFEIILNVKKKRFFQMNLKIFWFIKLINFFFYRFVFYIIDIFVTIIFLLNYYFKKDIFRNFQKLSQCFSQLWLINDLNQFQQNYTIEFYQTSRLECKSPAFDFKFKFERCWLNYISLNIR